MTSVWLNEIRSHLSWYSSDIGVVFSQLSNNWNNPVNLFQILTIDSPALALGGELWDIALLGTPFSVVHSVYDKTHTLRISLLGRYLKCAVKIQHIPKWTQIAKFMGPIWGSPESCRPQMGPMSAPWNLLSGNAQDFACCFVVVMLSIPIPIHPHP